jgi:hypothetical protein
VNPHHRPSASLVVAVLALVVSLTGTAYAAGGGSLLLGHHNKATKTTSLTSKGKGPALSVKAKRGPAASFRGGSGQPPFTVGSSTKVPGLDADQLDGLDASAFARADQSVSAVVSGSGTSTANSVLTTLAVNQVSYDPSGMRTTAAPNYLTAPRTGTYVFSTSVGWTANATGFRRVDLDINDTASMAYAVAPPNTGAQLAQNVVGIAHLNAGDKVDVTVLQTTGGNLTATLWNFEGAYVGP